MDSSTHLRFEALGFQVTVTVFWAGRFGLPGLLEIMTTPPLAVGCTPMACSAGENGSDVFNLRRDSRRYLVVDKTGVLKRVQEIRC